jgi:amidase
VTETNNAVLKQAADRDAERRRLFSADLQAQTQLPLLHGIPVFVKDIISTASPSPEENENLNTSAGSLALLGAFPSRDAPVVARLRESGAILLGKTNTVCDLYFLTHHEVLVD